jgi:hypothetical protein
MKALSIRQPWASLIVAGEKTIEWRSWSTKYRGDLLICSGQTPDDMYYEFDREEAATKWPRGVAVGIVTLVEVREFAPKDLDPAYMGDDLPDPVGFAWVVENPRKIKPFPVKGKLNLFNVENFMSA